MPLTRTATDLQRNMSEVAELCHKTSQPVYLTKNGMADLVIMDAQAFETATDLRQLAYERELRTLNGIQQGMKEIEAGLGRPYQEVRKDLNL